MNRFVKRVLSLTVAVSGLFAFGSYMILKAPEFHRNYLRNKVGSKVIMLGTENGGGTGFAVKAASGKTYTLTNRHVCELSTDGFLQTVVDEVPMRVKILKKSQTSDLCLVQNIKNRDGLNLSYDLKPGEEIAVVGHPQLLPLTISRGEFIDYVQIRMVTRELQSEADSCDKDEKTVAGFFGVYCVREFNSSATNVTVLGGNSGSPTVDFWGDVVGIVFAGDNRSNWGFLVPLNEMKDFLRNY